MAVSDDEEESVLQSVTNYHFVDDREEPVSFSILPIQLGDGESKDTSKTQVFLHGTADSGLQKIFKQVLAWRLEFSEDQPEILVFSKDKNWIKLLKPRKSFEETIRTSLITIHSIHFLKKNPGASKKSLWDHLNKIFSSYEVPPSEYDLLDQQPIIRTMVDADEALAKSELLLTFLEKPKKRKPSEQEFLMGNDAKLSKFIVDDDEDVEDNGGDESEEESDLFDSVCAICDNGGEILCCEGKCLRSFHATRAAGSESNCKSLGLSQAQVDAIQNFLCRNCKYKQHQCFACGKLGSSDKSANPEVFPCVSATCGHFYHPECVSKLLHAGDEAKIEEHRKKIVAGEAFTCPVHKCLVCKQGENKEVKELQFAVCRRCPRSYHRKCLPRKISFEDSDDGEIITRAWDNLIPNRILIYCPKHKIDEDLGTPIRNHILFPAIQEKKLVHRDLASSGTQVLTKKRKVVPENTSKETDMKSPRMGIKSSSTGKSERVGDFSKKPKTLMDLNKYSKNSSGKSNIYKAAQSPEPEENRASMKEEMLTNVGYIKGFETTKSKLNQSPHSKAEKTSSLISSTKRSSASLIIDDKTRDKIKTIMKKPLITLSGMMKNQKLPSTHMYYSRNVDKTITHGKVEGSVEAVRTALNKLEEGASIEDAKAVCEPEIINQIIKWKNKLNVYLAPFLHGMRYTSYGRHFTKVDKLKEIVEKLHWYVQSGDMIVDFCCGANDFSRLMKEKLDETGKRCSFKNFDLIQPKNDFNFEKKDWMQVNRDELPTGSQLIMGLNPPFGVRASLANKFIDKALEFKPKLLILIVPGETERLDKKKAAYDLIWEDSSKLSGKSFYLPGSVDVNDKQMEQWNAKPPLLYLWSRPDWTTKHRAVALQRGHLSVVQRNLQSEDDLHKTENWTQKEDISDCYKNLSKICDLPEQSDDLAEELEEKATCVVAEQTGDSPSKFDTQIDQSEHTEDAQTGIEERETSKKRSQEKLKEKERKGGKKSSDKSKRPDVKKDVIERAPSMIATPVGGLNPASPSDGVGIPDAPRDRTASEESPVRLHRGQTGSGSNLGSGYVGGSRSGPGFLDDITRRYSLNSEFGASYRKHSSSASLGLDYGSRATEIGVNNSDFLSQRTYMDDMSEHSRSEQDIRMPPRVYGHPDEFDQRRRYILGQESSLGNVGPLSTPFSLQAQSPLGRLDSIPLQRYMPHLDEGNYRHVPRPLPPGSHIANSMARMGPRPDSLDFVQGPLYPFPPHRGSSGWLND